MLDSFSSHCQSGTVIVIIISIMMTKMVFCRQCLCYLLYLVHGFMIIENSHIAYIAHSGFINWGPGGLRVISWPSMQFIFSVCPLLHSPLTKWKVCICRVYKDHILC